jgi:hypothetical protein
MDRGAMLAESHDHILRNLPETTGKTLAHWLGVLEKEGIQSRGFLAGLELLRDHRKVPHAEASAIAYAFLNPYMIPDDLRPGGGRRRADALAETLVTTQEANQRLAAPAKKAAKVLRAQVAAHRAKARATPKPAMARKPAAKPKPAARKAAAKPKPAAKAKPAATAKAKTRAVPAKKSAPPRSASKKTKAGKKRGR